MLYPCSACDRHLRDSEPHCPFCGAPQSMIEPPNLGALALAVALLGSTACGTDPSTDTAGTTTAMSSATTTSETSTSTEATDTGSMTFTTTLGTTETETTDNDTNWGGSFYAGAVPWDDGVWVRECDPIAQDCPEGEKCVPYASTGRSFDANKCVAVVGDGEPGDACVYGGIVEATDDCGVDSYCWAVGTDGVCVAFCEGVIDEPTCPMDIECYIANEGSVTLCISTCDPLLQDCDDGYGCWFNNGAFTCASTTEDLVLGAPCDALNDCAPGLVCMGADVVPDCAGDSCCAEYCDLGAPVCVQMGTECVAFFDDMPPVGHEDVGLCIIAP